MTKEKYGPEEANDGDGGFEERVVGGFELINGVPELRYAIVEQLGVDDV